MINNRKNKNHKKSEAGEYSITRLGCDKDYIVENTRSIKKRIYEHIRDFKINDDRTTFVKSYSETFLVLI